MPDEYDTMSVKDLKAFIGSCGYSHADCCEVAELRKRAREAEKGGAGPRQAGKKGAGGAGTSGGSSSSKSKDSTVRERKKGGANTDAASDSKVVSKKNGGFSKEDEEEMRTKAAWLQKESGQVIGGRDASVILAEVDSLKKALEEKKLSPDAVEQLRAQLDDVQKSLAFENTLEQHCGRVIQYVVLAVTIIPLLLSGLESAMEFAARPNMVVAPANLIDQTAVVTGGCGAVGLDLAVMLANSGAEVVISCHGETSPTEAKLSKQGLLQQENQRKKGRTSRKGWIKVLPLQLESFASVRAFADQVLKEWKGLDLLVHNAATKEGCGITEDGHELSTQVNYLSPFLLTQLLFPALREGASRVVHVTCDVALQQPDWLPWPLTRTQAEALPRVDLNAIDEGRESDWGDDGDSEPDAEGGRVGSRLAPAGAKECSPLSQYASSKLAMLVHSHELNRRLPDLLDRGVSHVVNPGTMDNEFGRTASVPEGKKSARSSFMGNLPMVWIASGIYQYTFGAVFSKLSLQMYRSTKTGAKAVFHVAIAEGLGSEEHGGGLFADTAGAFTECGKAPEACGRVPLQKQPAAASDEDLASALWDRTESAIGRSNLQPLRRGTAA